MHVAVVMGTMLLGSWVLNSPDAEEEAGIPEEVQLQEQQERGVVPPYPTSPRMPYNTMSPQPGQPMAPGAQPGATTPRAMPMSGSQAGSPSQAMQIFPSAPTDASTGVFGQPLAPTSNAVPGDASRFTPMAPTHSSSGGFRSKLPNLLNRYRSGKSSSSAGSDPSPASEKAFGNYRPTSGVSPYMNLFRVGGETVDNYTSLVRPQLDQRFANQQFNRDIRSLQRSSSMQRVNLNQLYRANQTLQGVATPQFYMQAQGGGQ